MTRRKHRYKGGVAFELSQIKHDSTCLSLSLPKSICCDQCQDKMDLDSVMMRKSSYKQKKFCHLHENNRCKQLWLSKYGGNNRCTCTSQRHVRVRNYLNIVLDVKIVYASKNNKNYETQPSDLSS
eukprot:2456526-Ditylum_brightwellii.AAC.1